ncbi:hypothetical protein C8R44DRAFT_736532 [Mycena epipterygia]|nr:hypothetical protein C8R44DRAFT_736532 [Mycena epipterygia]
MDPASPLTLSSMEDLNALPMYLNNQIQVDENDGIAHVSTYLLNSSYDFVEVVNPVTLATLYHADIGVKFIAVHLTNVAAFVALYDHLSNRHLGDHDAPLHIIPSWLYILDAHPKYTSGTRRPA